MQRARRWRRVVKWGLLAVAVGFATLAIATWRWVPGWTHIVTPPQFNIYVIDGVMVLEKSRTMITWEGVPPREEFSVQRRRANFLMPEVRAWVPQWERTVFGVRAWLPMWVPFLLSLGPFLYLWRADRKAARLARAGGCASCGYDRVGLLAGAACPECGALPKGAAVGGGAS